MVLISALPLFRAKRRGEEEGQKLDPLELSNFNYGHRKSHVRRRIGVGKMKIQKFEATSSSGRGTILQYCQNINIEL